MRKVLLATTALVAMTGAASAEVSITGFYEFNYVSVSDDITSTYDQFTNDTEVHISFSETTDNGLTFGMKTELEGATTDGVDEGSMFISGDFGTVTLGENDGAYGNMMYFGNTHGVGSAGHSMPQTNKASTPADLKVMFSPFAIDSGDDTNKIVYTAPSMGGFNFQYGYEEAGSASEEPNTSASVKYSADMGGATVSVAAAMFDSGESTDAGDGTYVGAQISTGDATITFAQGASKTGSATDVSGSAFGIDYVLNDQLTINAEYFESSNDVAAEDDTFESTGVGVSYSIAPGLAVNLMTHNFEANDGAVANVNNSGSVIRASINASF